MTRHSLALACALALTAGTGAFAQSMSEADMQKLVDAAKAEGSLMIYSGANADQLKRYAEGFSAKYGIDAQFVRLTGAQTVQRFSTEADAGALQADIMGTSEGGWYDSHADWFMDLTQEHLPNVDAWPDDSKTNTHVTITRGIIGLIYNTDEVKKEDAPKVWSDVVDPKYKGQILLSDVQISVNWGGWLKVTHDVLGDDFTKALAKQDFQIVASTATGAQQTAAGAKELNFPSANTFAQSLMVQGAPIEYVFMSEPTVVNAFQFGAAAGAPHPNAAKLFMNWLLSDEGITATCTNNLTMSPMDPEGKLGCLKKPDGDLVQIPDSLDDATMQPIYDLLGVK